MRNNQKIFLLFYSLFYNEFPHGLWVKTCKKDGVVFFVTNLLAIKAKGFPTGPSSEQRAAPFFERAPSWILHEFANLAKKLAKISKNY